MDEKKEFYQKLKKRLEETTTFPTEYMFKFIVPTEGEGIQDIEKIFSEKETVISTKKSKNGKYTSVTILLKMETSKSIINKYQQAEKVKNIISL